ncbi:MAG: hypothetical protein VST71_12555 [Nitrospirota bacterium]|nr:hypothetical protein [Nitrospirota bacterium]
MAYIIVLQPMVLSGRMFGFFFVSSVLPGVAAAGFANTWQVGLGVVFISGVLFLLLSVSGIRKKT